MKFITKLAEAATPSSEKEYPFMVMTQMEFNAISPADIKNIFRTKHIIVKGMEHDVRMRFDRRGLERVGNWDEHRTLQGSLFILTFFPYADFFQTCLLNLTCQMGSMAG
jgi:hypothetical protein